MRKRRWPMKLAVLHQRQKGLCALCGNSLNLAEANLDHKIPKSAGGTNGILNLQATHISCNTAKGSKIVRPKNLDDADGFTRARERLRQRFQGQNYSYWVDLQNHDVTEETFP